MSLSNEERKIIVDLELERTDKILAQLQTLREKEYWDTLVNRMYYAAFHAVNALLIHNSMRVHTHKGALIMFNKDFVHTGLITQEEGRLFTQLESLRERGDYNCFIDASEQEVVPLIEPLKDLIEKIKHLIKD